MLKKLLGLSFILSTSLVLEGCKTDGHITPEESHILTKYNIKEIQDSQRSEAIFRNTEGWAFKPRWPRREAEDETEKRLQFDVKIDLPISLPKTAFKKLGKSATVGWMGKKKIKKLFGPGIFLKFRARIGSANRIVTVTTNDQRLELPVREEYINGQPALVINKRPEYDYLILCEHELYLEGIAGAGVNFDVLVGGVKATGEILNTKKLTQSTGVLKPIDGKPVSDYKDMCDQQFDSRAFDSLLAELKMRIKHSVMIQPKTLECFVPDPISGNIADLTNKDLITRRDGSDKGCEETAQIHSPKLSSSSFRSSYWGVSGISQFTINDRYPNGYFHGRCVSNEGITGGLGNCIQYAREGKPCSLYRNEDGTVTEKPHSDHFEILTESSYARPCDKTNNLECKVVQEGGYFKTWYSVWRPWKGQCMQSSERPPIETIEAASKRVNADWKRRVRENDLDFKLTSFFKNDRYIEPSGISFEQKTKTAFIVADDNLDIYRLKFSNDMIDVEAEKIELDVNPSLPVITPDNCKKCEVNTVSDLWFSSVSGFEGVSHQRKDDQTVTLQLAIEAVNVRLKTGKSQWMPAVAEVELKDDQATLTKFSVLNIILFKDFGANKGVEGVKFIKTPSMDILFALCESPNCGDTVVGSGSLFVFGRTQEKPEWNLLEKINLPIPFTDFSGIDIDSEGRLIIISQELARFWIGKINLEDFSLEQQEIASFPIRDSKYLDYCNVEGVAWVDDKNLLLVSDMMKGADMINNLHPNLKKSCINGSQSIHKFSLDKIIN